MSKKTNRRKFLKDSVAASAGFMIVPRHVLGGKGFVAPSDEIRIAGIGVGGRGAAILRDASKSKFVKIVALCDVDDNRAAPTYKAYEKAKQYKDYRKLLEKEKGIDAIMVGTPDHTHAGIALAAMELGKHVYIEKPLTHNIYEARLLTEAAAKYKVVTQMGNQGTSGDGVRKIQEWLEADLIGEVTKVHCWTNRPIWPQGVATPSGEHKVPATLDWDLWLGPAKMRKYHPSYLPFKWRGWWDYGTGALGDMGCHIIDPPFKALKLGYPTAVEASVTQVYVGDFVLADIPDSCPPSSKVHFDFPARENMPAVELIWYDGGIMPQRPTELRDDEELSEDGGCIFEGSKGKIMCGVYGRDPKLLPSSRMAKTEFPKESIQRIPEGHQLNWVNAIKDGTPTTSSFDYSGPLTETVLMGNLAIRSYNLKMLKEGKKPGDWAPWKYPGRRKLTWDGPNMKITNFDEANQFVKREYRTGWEL